MFSDTFTWYHVAVDKRQCDWMFRVVIRIL